ncbi:hypothetical protein BKA67DRAFT_651385 [Truncatella angustata]|uniref:Uncharacterized protein n=1 Tax=Truncatella angustata TaxID=152316 RepID=A0A9P8RKF8_9PEZI|nr:uncharacterized protein BKA67DRAFT_651385 [Truncatella angustata]KAH6645691.1 hypothetical protein BKA67DRAFT_651385 [Truncatella angustata]
MTAQSKLPSTFVKFRRLSLGTTPKELKSNFPREKPNYGYGLMFQKCHRAYRWTPPGSAFVPAGEVPCGCPSGSQRAEAVCKCLEPTNDATWKCLEPTADAVCKCLEPRDDAIWKCLEPRDDAIWKCFEPTADGLLLSRRRPISLVPAGVADVHSCVPASEDGLCNLSVVLATNLFFLTEIFGRD